MSDNILLSHDILHFLNGRKTSGPNLAAVKIDMSKAYDRIHWGFLLRALKAYGFPSSWIQLIYQCISTVSFKVLINGRTSTAFKPKCGLRQGDPLSPYLFLFCMDILGRMLTLGQDIKLFQGIKLARQAPKITHLFFADDAKIFFQATETSCMNVGGIIDRYCRISGQQLNLAKSFVKFSPNTSLSQQQNFKTILRMPKVTQFGQHLGVPVDCMVSKRLHFNYLIDKVVDLINSWNGVLLSQPQKLVLINSVIVAMVSHVMMSLEIPISISNRIDSMISTFFWSKQGKKGMHWVRRDILHLPRGMGGNFALTTGKPNLLHGRASWGMRGLRRAANVLLQGCSWKVGNGDTIKAGRDKWVNGRIPIFSSHIRLTDAKSWKVSHFIKPNHLHWDAGLVRNTFDHMDAKEIMSLELPTGTVMDQLYWTKYKTGHFTMKCGYAFLREAEIKQDFHTGLGQNRFVPFFKLLWALKILPKWKLFIWKIMVDGLPVKKGLGRRGIRLNTSCDLCIDVCEDAQHIFRLCNLAQDVWRSSMLVIFSNFNENLSIQDWILNYIHLFNSVDGKGSDRVVTFIAILWGLWITRNARVFRSENGDIQACHMHVKLAREQHLAFAGKSNVDLGFLHPPELSPVYPPGFDFANIGLGIPTRYDSVIYVDGSWNKIPLRAGMGWIFQQLGNAESRTIGGCDYGLGQSALHVEAMACLRALQWEKDCSLPHIVLYTDSATLVSYLERHIIPEISVRWTIQAIFEIGMNFLSCVINKVHRDQVHLAHFLATRAAKDGLQFVTPVDVRSMIN
ncbi:uncharacterized protein [Spinacia oleracea]|uniref:Reverse transcriptase domain-containing protein n=1 Tax=Spinacia oleracea TaxID=3562 RepID=A0A9R0IJ85_SPIOL|nr:uncharacterized protein LOC110789947 [Spinacia oleracea]